MLPIKKLLFCFILIIGTAAVVSGKSRVDELDRVFIYLNNRLVGTWRADVPGVVEIDKIADGDTLTFKARTDLFGLGNSSIDIKDDNGVPIDNIQSSGNTDEAASFTYIFHVKTIDTNKASSLQVFLNVDPARNLPPPVIATIFLNKK